MLEEVLQYQFVYGQKKTKKSGQKTKNALVSPKEKNRSLRFSDVNGQGT